MATTTFPRGQGIRRNRWLIGGVAVIMIGIIAALLLSRFSSSSTVAPATTPVASGNVVATVAGSGAVTAVRSLDLPFQTSGQVTEVLVKEGDTVSAGQALARLDARDLQLKVDSAQANLTSAKAKLAQTEQGNATEQDTAAQQATVANAAAQLEQTRTGNTTAADIAQTAAQLRSAQAKLDDLLAGPKPQEVSSAQLTLDQARSDVARLQASFQETKDSLSKAKTDADSSLKQATIDLETAQSEYSTAYWKYYGVQSNGSAPGENKGQTNPALSDYGNLEQREAFKQAELKLRNAEETVGQKQTALENARQAEITGVAQAQEQLTSAQAKAKDAEVQLQVVQQGATQLDLAQAQASVDQYRASLQKLQQGGTPAEVAASQANLDKAKADLAKLTASGTATDREIQQANVAVAEQDLKQAQYNLEQATLTVPFAGIVTKVNIVPGSIVSTSAAAVSLVDRSTLTVDMTLSENDVAQVALSQPVTLTIDALSDWTGKGVVTYIAPNGETSNGVVTYKVRVSFPDGDARVKVGMTANVKILTAQKQGVLLVPNSALLPKGSGKSVQMTKADGTTYEVDVKAGLTDGVNSEIVSGLKEGDRVVTTPVTTKTQSRGLFGRG